MAGTSRRTTGSVKDALWKEPQQFNFFQAVRLLEWIHAEESSDDDLGEVGADTPPSAEAVRFRAQVALTFPASAIIGLQVAEAAQRPRPPAMTVSFFGLHGPMGVLPRHYTAHLIERCHVRHRDYALRDFLDAFNHRAISLYYRAWEKYRFVLDYERVQRRHASDDDLFTYCLLCLVGLGTDGLTARLRQDRQTIIYYGGHFARTARNATSLADMLADYFGLPTRIEQFQGQWLYLSADEQSSLPSTLALDGRNCELGINVVVGERVWDVQSKFRVRVGPLTYDQFARFMPVGDMYAPLLELVRFYAGAEFDFDLQPVLQAAEVPACQLSLRGAIEPRLGWNTWLINQPLTNDAHDAVFMAP